jgi:general stress protein 26
VTDSSELEARLWKALDKDRTVMLGLDGVRGGHLQPMTALVEDGRAPIWFFTSSDTDFARRLSAPQAGLMAFSSKGHELFATAQGELCIDNDRAVIDRLWNPFAAAWFESGKDDPKVTLLRFDATRAEVWLNENSLLAGVKLLLGVDPKKDYQDKVGDVDLR